MSVLFNRNFCVWVGALRAGAIILISPDRKTWLDGLRGVAALTVFIGHLLLALFGAFWIFNGRAAVCVFFVLSGFVLADLTERSTLSLPAQMLRRYLRLVGPMLLTSAFAWALLALGFYRNTEASAVTGSTWLGAWYQFEPSFFAMVWETVYGVFASGEAAYNCNLWTMRPELIGSIAVFVIGSAVPHRIARTGCYFAFAAWFWSDYLLLFSVGALLYEFKGGICHALRASLVRILCLAAGLFFFIATDKVMGRLYLSQDMLRWQMLSATLIVAAVLASPLLQRLLAGAIWRELGRMSFTLYLIHIPVICSLTSWLVIALPRAIALPTSVALTIATVLGASFALCRVVDEWPTKISRSAGFGLDGLIISARPLAQRGG